MSETIELPTEVFARLRAEAARRSVSIDELVAELADQLLPAEPASTHHRLAFVAAGSSACGITPHIGQSLADGFGRD